MSVHTDSHAQWLTRLALGEEPRDVPGSQELLACPECGEEARELLEMAERLAQMDQARDSILEEVERSKLDPERAARALHNVELAERRSRDELRRRRLGRFLLALAATVLIGVAISIWKRAGDAPSDGRGVMLGQNHLEIIGAQRAEGGGFELLANRAPRAGCTLSFVVLTSPPGETLGTFSSSSAACTIPKERTAGWPESLELYVQERDAANQALISSPARLWPPPH